MALMDESVWGGKIYSGGVDPVQRGDIAPCPF